MPRFISTALFLVLPALGFAEDRLPAPDYHRQLSDPAWLAQVVQLHGHLGPSVVAGARMGMIGRDAVAAKGYFDVEVTCEGPLALPPQACFLDGIQAATGATTGKRTLNWVQADKLVVRVKNTLTGKTVALQPTPALLGLLASFRPEAKAGTGHGPGQQDHERLEQIARKIAAMPDSDIASAIQADGHVEAAATAAFVPSFTYQNPNDFSYLHFDGTVEKTITELRDPAIIREGNLYYLTFTAFPFTHSDSRKADKIDYNSSPGIMLYSSPDLKRWKFEKWLVKSSDLPEDCPYKHRFWAPEIHKIGGKFYLIFTADNWIKDRYNRGGKIGAYVAFVGTADEVTGPYRHITWLKGAGCDTTLFGDDDGKTYAIMPFGDEFIQEVDLTGIEQGDIKLVGPRRMIVSRDNKDVGRRTSPDYLEGPWMIKRKGKYILFTAAPYRKPKLARQTSAAADLAEGYWVGAAVADNIWGPYRKQPQVFLGGHIAVFQGPDGKEWFSYRGEARGKSQGRLCLDPIQFTETGLIVPFLPSTEQMIIPGK